MRATRSERDIAATSGFKAKRSILSHPGLHQPLDALPNGADIWSAVVEIYYVSKICVYTYIHVSAELAAADQKV